MMNCMGEDGANDDATHEARYHRPGDGDSSNTKEKEADEDAACGGGGGEKIPSPRDERTTPVVVVAPALMQAQAKNMANSVMRLRTNDTPAASNSDRLSSSKTQPMKALFLRQNSGKYFRKGKNKSRSTSSAAAAAAAVNGGGPAHGSSQFLRERTHEVSRSSCGSFPWDESGRSLSERSFNSSTMIITAAVLADESPEEAERQQQQPRDSVENNNTELVLSESTLTLTYGPSLFDTVDGNNKDAAFLFSSPQQQQEEKVALLAVSSSLTEEEDAIEMTEALAMELAQNGTEGKTTTKNYALSASPQLAQLSEVSGDESSTLIPIARIEDKEHKSAPGSWSAAAAVTMEDATATRRSSRTNTSTKKKQRAKKLFWKSLPRKDKKKKIDREQQPATTGLAASLAASSSASVASGFALVPSEGTNNTTVSKKESKKKTKRQSLRRVLSRRTATGGKGTGAKTTGKGKTFASESEAPFGRTTTATTFFDGATGCEVVI